MGDISKKGVAVLLVVTILVSLLGTLTVLTTLNQTASEILPLKESHGHVSIEIVSLESQTSAGSGDVTIEILK